MRAFLPDLPEDCPFVVSQQVLVVTSHDKTKFSIVDAYQINGDWRLLVKNHAGYREVFLSKVKLL